MSKVEYVTLEDVLELVRKLGIGPVRDIGLLDSAVARPGSSAFGEDAYPSIELKASALLYSLTKNHALVDGNKRIAWLVTVVFLRMNEMYCGLTDEDAFSLVWDIASGHLELSEISDRLKISAVESFGCDSPSLKTRT